jgi:hypothetical protein
MFNEWTQCCASSSAYQYKYTHSIHYSNNHLPHEIVWCFKYVQEAFTFNLIDADTWNVFAICMHLYITGYDLASVPTSLHVATYVLALHPTNRAANCCARCELHDPVHSNKFEHKECSVIIFGCAYDSGSNVILLCMQSFVHVGQ